MKADLRDIYGAPTRAEAEAAIDTFAEVANIGAVAILFNLERALKERRVGAGDLVLMYSPGAGFTRAALVYRVGEPLLE